MAKFKKRRGKPDKTKQFSIGSFLEWFEGSQALERIIILEKYPTPKTFFVYPILDAA